MKTIKYTYLKITFFLGLIMLTGISCEREISDQATFATYPTTPEVFIDGFSSGLQYFPFGDSKLDAFTVDTSEKFAGTSSMRFDVPAFGIGYAGANFPSSGARDLTGYDALTFWAKGSKSATINEIGFGLDGDTDENKFRVTKSGLAITTNWVKYVIAIPDPSKLDAEKGLFWYAEGAQNATDEGGYTFWIDELKYEKLGTIGQAQPKILNGEDKTQIAIVGSPVSLSGLTQTLNLGSGEDQTLSIAPSYFTFKSSNNNVAQVSELGVVRTISAGTAVITAELDGVKAKGSLTVNVTEFQFAPMPTLPASDVISIFSDVYTNEPVDFYNGFYAPFQSTTSNDFVINGDNILSYQNYNFVGIEFNQNVPTIDASSMTSLHLDFFVPGAIASGSAIRIRVRDLGLDGSINNDFNGNPNGDDTEVTYLLNVPELVSETWIGVDFSIASLSKRNSLGQITLDSPSGTSPSSFLVDNIYFHK